MRKIFFGQPPRTAKQAKTTKTFTANNTNKGSNKYKDKDWGKYEKQKNKIILFFFAFTKYCRCLYSVFYSRYSRSKCIFVFRGVQTTTRSWRCLRGRTVFAFGAHGGGSGKAEGFGARGSIDRRFDDKQE
jgi:hypothetical protein